MARYKLSEICKIVSGSTPKTNVPEYWDGENIWITPAEITDKTFIVYDSQRKLSKLGVEKTHLSSFPKGTVILSSRAPIGKVAIAGVEMFCNQGFKNLICSEKIMNEYLYWFLKGKTKYLNSLGRGATFKELSAKIIGNIELEVPSIQEQKEVVIRLRKIDQIIGVFEREVELLDELVKARFVEMFGEIEDCDRWKSKIWNEVVTIQNGKDYKKVLVDDGGYPVVGTGGEIARASGYLCPENTIVVGRKGSINNPMLMKEKFWNVDTAFGVIPNSDYLHYQYFYYFCRFYNFMKLNKATTLPSTTKADLLKIRINIPPLELQNQFASFVKEIDKSRSRIQKSLEASQELFDSLMQEYFG